MLLFLFLLTLVLVKTLYSNTQCTMSNNNSSMKFNMQQPKIQVRAYRLIEVYLTKPFWPKSTKEKPFIKCTSCGYIGYLHTTYASSYTGWIVWINFSSIFRNETNCKNCYWGSNHELTPINNLSAGMWVLIAIKMFY